MKCFHSLTQGIRHFADVIIPQQSPPFGPELGQLCIQGSQLGPKEEKSARFRAVQIPIDEENDLRKVRRNILPHG